MTYSAIRPGANATLNGALRISVEDADALGLVDGGRARITTAAGSAEASVEVSETMLPGHASLPNGYGLDFTDDDGRARIPGVAPNTLTSTEWRDPYAGTPWHKHVPSANRALIGGHNLVSLALPSPRPAELSSLRRRRRQQFGGQG